MKMRIVPTVFVLLTVIALAAGGDEALYVVTPLTPENSFTDGIEGPACDRAGNVYVVNFKKQQTIGRITHDGQAEVFVTLPGKSVGNGIVFDPAGAMYVADYVEHKIYKLDPVTRELTVFAHDPKMTQPNDLAIAPNGTLYASDPDWIAGTGRVWRIARDGTATLAAADMGTTNGLDVAPDGKTLYVNESGQKNVWAFTIAADGTLGDKRLLKNFADFGLDGMRCDAAGNLYLSRYGGGKITVLSPTGDVVRDIALPGTTPSNLCFGGADGRTVYVTEVSSQRLLRFRTDTPGLAWRRWQEKKQIHTGI